MAMMDTSSILDPVGEDTCVAEQVRVFIGNLQHRIQAIEQAIASDSPADLARLAHQLKRAGGDLGFETIEATAAALERSAKAAGCVSDVAAEITELISMCRWASTQPWRA